MDRGAHLGDHWTPLVDRLADDVEDAAQGLGSDRHRDRLAGIRHFGAAHQPVGRIHRDRADNVLPELLRHFEDQSSAAIIDVQRGQDRRQLAVEVDVDDGADHLRNGTDGIPGHVLANPRMEDYSASAPEMISISSLVMTA